MARASAGRAGCHDRHGEHDHVFTAERARHMRRSGGVGRARVLVLATAASIGCGHSVTRLDEATLFDRSGFRVKVVRYAEHLPLSFDGKMAVVQCQSQATRTRAGGENNDAGWVILDRFAALESRNATEVLAQARERVLLAGEELIVWNHGMVLTASLDGCRSFSRWDARRVPTAWTLQVQPPSYCMPTGAVDCSGQDFRFVGERTPAFSDVQVGPGDSLGFVVRSAAFPKGTQLVVRSGDRGRTWEQRVVKANETWRGQKDDD